MQLVSYYSWSADWLLTSISHHYFLDGSVHRLRGGVGKAGENARPLDGQQADAAFDCDVLQHPRRQRGEKKFETVSRQVGAGVLQKQKM